MKNKNMHQELKNFLGEELYEKFEGIRPLIALCSYRIKTYNGYGTFDMMFNTEEQTALLSVYRRLVYPLVYIKNVFTQKVSDGGVMLSSTVYKSGRYGTLINDIRSQSAVLQTNAATDITIPSPNGFGEYLKKLFGAGYGKRVMSCHSVSGDKLRKAVLRWLEFCVVLYNNQQTCLADMQKADALLSVMESEFKKRVDYAVKELKKCTPNLYITINQYNLRDMVMISACRELGIKTKQMEHHASRFMHNIASTEGIDRFCFVDEICCWSESEEDFHKNVYKYECFPFTDKPIISTVGNPEVLYKDALKATVDNPEAKRVTFMVSGLLNKTSEAEVEKQLSHRNKIFENLKKLSEKHNVKILVRYPPGVDKDFKAKEEQKLKEMGFDISPSDRGSLMSDIGGSNIIVGTISSVLGVSALMGKQVYQIASENEKYYITDKNIISISPEEICNIDISVQALPLDKNGFMDCAKLLDKSISKVLV